MIECSKMYESMLRHGFEFFAGVPDSLLKNFCFYVSDNAGPEKHIITANEGSAVALATGYHLATGKTPVVYMQNSGLGNAVNPLLSLADPDVYSIPMLLLVGWRGEPGVKDEPQHLKQGKVMLDSLTAMGIRYEILGPDSDVEELLTKAKAYVAEHKAPMVLAVKKGSFGSYDLKNKSRGEDYSLCREEALDLLLDSVGSEDVIVATTGKTSRELYELREKRSEPSRADFLVVGSMGHASQIALGMALEQPERKVFCVDGDGSLLMHAGGLAAVAKTKAKNFFHVMINNGAHESVGGQSTGAFDIDWTSVVKGFGYPVAYKAESKTEFMEALQKLLQSEGPAFLEMRVRQGSRSDLGRPKTSPIENKQQLMKVLRIE